MFTVKDHDIIDKIPKSYGIGIKFSDKEEEYISIYEDDFPRKVVLDITSWKGITAGALHHYGVLKVGSIKCQNLRTGKISYLKKSAPKAAKGLTVHLTRTLTKRDLLIESGERFKGAKIGERIKNFDSVKDVETAAIKFFNEFFLEGWNLIRLKPVESMSFGGTSIVNNEVILSQKAV
ncbi:MAG: hypothetical protein NE328_22485 [Lentisphaeraceae bacterium]|nr:hypothetical protein [Lentisphaeraceae bacterium]